MSVPEIANPNERQHQLDEERRYYTSLQGLEPTDTEHVNHFLDWLSRQ